MFVPLIVEASIDSLNVTVTVVFVATLVAFGDGLRAVIVGAVVSASAAVVNCDVNWDASELPATSFTAVVTVSV
jgi:hypothetical protein